MNLKSKISIYLIYCFTAFLVIAVNYYDYYQNKQTVHSMLEQKGMTLSYFLQQTTENAILSIDNLENSITERLLDNTRLAAELTLCSNRQQPNLQTLIMHNPLSTLAIVQEDRWIHSAGNFADTLTINEAIHDFLLSNNNELLSSIIQPENAPAYFFALIRMTENRVAVGIADAKNLNAVYQQVGLNRLLEKFVQNKYLVYAAIQDERGIISATGNIDTLGTIPGHQALEQISKTKQPLVRNYLFGQQEVLEIIDNFYLDGRRVGLLRLGLNMQPLQEIYLQMRLRSILIIFLLLSGAVVVIKLVEHREKAIVLSRKYKVLENELMRKNKLLAIENLASGVAHEIRNPLNGISTLLQQLLAEYRPVQDYDDFDQLGKILQNEIRRINTIVENFQNYARPYKINLSTFAASDLWKEISALISPEIRSASIMMKENIENIEITADYSGLKQCLINLLKNSIEAIKPATGEISISINKNKEQIQICVQDSGSGITEENIKHIFNPYFTTKSGGNGLGLAIVDKIIRENNGEVIVESKSCCGTKFKIYLPIIARGNLLELKNV